MSKFESVVGVTVVESGIIGKEGAENFELVEGMGMGVRVTAAVMVVVVTVVDDVDDAFAKRFDVDTEFVKMLVVDIGDKAIAA